MTHRDLESITLWEIRQCWRQSNWRERVQLVGLVALFALCSVVVALLGGRRGR